jgi:hypothetical protein
MVVAGGGVNEVALPGGRILAIGVYCEVHADLDRLAPFVST